MSPFFDLGSLRKSPLVNRVRSIYRNNTSDPALETLRMESVNLSHIRDLSTGFKSSSSDSSEGSFQRINFAHRKRFNERLYQRSRSRSNESLNLDKNNRFSDQGEGRNCEEDSLRSSIDEFESPLDSDYKTPDMSPDRLSPLNFLLNYRQSTDKSEEYKDAQSLSSYMSLVSDDITPEKSQEGSIVKSEGDRDTVVMDRYGDNDVISSGKSVKKDVDHSKSPKSAARSTESVDSLSYSFDKSCYVFRILFEPKLSTVKDTNLIPSRVIVNKTPFLIGSDSACDLVLSRKKFKFIAQKHCKMTFHSSQASEISDSSYTTATTTKTNSVNTSPIDSVHVSPKSKSNVASPSNLSKLKVKTEDTSTAVYESNGESDDIVPFRVKICKCSPSAVVYVNSSLIRGSQYLENGDLISLGLRTSNITFRVVFQNRKQCQLLKSQLETQAAQPFDTQHSQYMSLNSSEDTEGECSLSESVDALNDDRIVLFDDINITGVKIFVFQVFNYNVDTYYGQNYDDESEEQYLDEFTQDEKRMDELYGSNYECLSEEREVEQGVVQSSGENASQYHPSECGTQQSMENSGMSQPTETEDYYKLKSPIRNYNVLKSPAKRSARDVQIKNLESFKADALIEVYSSSERMSTALSNYNMSQESNYGVDQVDSQSSTHGTQFNFMERLSNVPGSQNSTSLNEEEYMHKVKFLKSIIPNNFPIAIDTNNSLSGSTTPRSGKTHYKLIGTVDAANNMNIAEILPSIDELVRKNIDESLVNFQVVLKNFNMPVEREMLENSWVFQLEFLDVSSPKIRRAIFKHKMFKEDQQGLEKVLKENKCRVMYIKTD